MVVSAVSSRVAMVARYVVVPVAGGGATHQLQRGFTIGGSCPGALRRSARSATVREFLAPTSSMFLDDDARGSSISPLTRQAKIR